MAGDRERRGTEAETRGDGHQLARLHAATLPHPAHVSEGLP